LSGVFVKHGSLAFAFIKGKKPAQPRRTATTQAVKSAKISNAVNSILNLVYPVKNCLNLQAIKGR